jgi:type IV fimbrial biogenesis protein FimT
MGGATTVRRVTRAGTAPNFTYPAATSSLSSRQYITFSPRGSTTAGAASFFRICDSSYPNVPGRIVQVSLVGKVSLDSTAENCAL